MELVQFIRRMDAKDIHKRFPDARLYDTSYSASFASDYEYVTNANEFSSFVNYGRIPVPGLEGVFSDSVEGIWQGLKLIKGKIDPSYFKGKGRMRYGQPKGHLLGNRIIGYVESRKRIYIHSYEFMILYCAPKESLERIITLANLEVKQFFFDVDDNPDVHNPKQPLAHSAVLVDILNKRLNLPNPSFSRDACRA